MTARDELGRTIKTYKGKTITWIDFFLWVVPGTMIPIGLMFYGAYLRYFDYTQSMLKPEAWFLIASVLLLPFAALALRRFRSSRKALSLHENGIRFLHIDSQLNTLLYCQISGIRTQPVQYHFLGMPVTDRFSMYIEPVHGREIHIPSDIENLVEAADRIKSKIYPLLEPSMHVELEQGQTISFGEIRISRQEIMTRKKTLPWSAVKEIQLESGHFILTDHDEKRIKLPVSKIPNVELFFQLTNQKFTD